MLREQGKIEEESNEGPTAMQRSAVADGRRTKWLVNSEPVQC